MKASKLTLKALVEWFDGAGTHDFVLTRCDADGDNEPAQMRDLVEAFVGQTIGDEWFGPKDKEP